MYFDDGANPWKKEENFIRVFDFSNYDNKATNLSWSAQLLIMAFISFLMTKAIL